MAGAIKDYCSLIIPTTEERPWKWASPEETGSPQGSWHNGSCVRGIVAYPNKSRLIVLFHQVQIKFQDEAVSYGQAGVKTPASNENAK